MKQSTVQRDSCDDEESSYGVSNGKVTDVSDERGTSDFMATQCKKRNIQQPGGCYVRSGRNHPHKQNISVIYSYKESVHQPASIAFNCIAYVNTLYCCLSLQSDLN